MFIPNVCHFSHTIKHEVKTCPSGILKGDFKKNQQKHIGKFGVCLANSKQSS